MVWRVKCANSDYYVARRFDNAERAQAWIDQLEQRREQKPALCEGPHTIIEIEESHED